MFNQICWVLAKNARTDVVLARLMLINAQVAQELKGKIFLIVHAHLVILMMGTIQSVKLAIINVNIVKLQPRIVLNVKKIELMIQLAPVLQEHMIIV